MVTSGVPIFMETNMADDNPPTIEPMLQFFKYEHLPEKLRVISAPFGKLAHDMVEKLPRNAERSAGLRKLLEAKDCAVRAVIYE
jgi:hypothetical protein